MALDPNGYASWQEALGALVKENGLENSELGDIARLSVIPRNLMVIIEKLVERNAALEVEIIRLKIAAAETAP